jgi:hypothetical protein
VLPFRKQTFQDEIQKSGIAVKVNLALALILHERGNDGQTLMLLAGLAYFVFIDTGIMIQPVPIAIEDWLNPETFSRPRFLRNVEREGIVL